MHVLCVFFKVFFRTSVTHCLWPETRRAEAWGRASGHGGRDADRHGHQSCHSHHGQTAKWVTTLVCLDECLFFFFLYFHVFAPKQRICLPCSQQGKELQVQVKPVLSLSDCHCGTCSCQTFCPRSGAQCAIHCHVLCSLFNYVHGCVRLFMWMQNKCLIFKCVL